ncbi:retrotransposon protein, putative, ty1-copia subclass [Tanacetum coccineum]
MKERRKRGEGEGREAGGPRRPGGGQLIYAANEKVTQFGFSRSEDESCIYINVSGSVVVFLVLYVDDILLIGNDIPTLQSVKEWLGKCFAMKDLGDAAYVLGIMIYRDRTRRVIGLSQDTYIDKILKRFKMENSKKGNLPLHHGIKISTDLCSKTDEELDRMSQVLYASAVGSIILGVRAVKDISIWMKNFIGDLGVVPTVQDPIEILCDNESAVALTKEPKDHEKSKHIERKYIFCSKQSKRRTHDCETHTIKDNPANPFTKALANLAVALDDTLCLVDRDRLRPIIVDELSKWETVGISVQMSSENGVNTPAPNPSPNSSFSLLSVLGRERLTGPNYMDWMRNLRFTLRYENKEYVLDEQIPIIDNDSTQEEIEAHQKHYDDANKAKASKKRLDVVKSLMACKPKPEASICAFVLEMKGYFDRLESLNMAFDAELSINIILSGLPADYNQFVLSYQMNGKETSIMELHSLLQTAEQGIKKSDVPSTSAAPVLNVGHNAKKRKTSHSNWKGKA